MRRHYLYWSRNILYIINIMFMTSFVFHMQDVNTLYFITTIIIMIALGILLIKNHVDQDTIIYDKKYNLVFLISNLMILVIFLRNYFDFTIPVGNLLSLSQHFYERSSFFNYNLIYIVLITLGLFGYNILNKSRVSS